MTKKKQAASIPGQIPGSIVQATMKHVTTVSKYGGIGLAYRPADGTVKVRDDLTFQMDGNQAYRSGGNGWYYLETFETIIPDDGAGYRDAVNRVGLGHLFDLCGSQAK